MKLLVVDDDKQYRKILTEIIIKQGHAVVEAENGAEALAQITAEGPFDAIITDMQMRVMTGLEFIQALRGVHKEVPCLLHSAEVYANLPEVGYIELKEVSQIFPFVEFHSKFEQRYVHGFLEKIKSH
jgi:CheY-like chemotaxis protein